MLRSYLKVAFRNLLKNRLDTSINFLGLTAGLTCFLLLGMYMQYELSYDTQHEHSASIYRIAKQQRGDVFRGEDRSVQTPAPLASTLVESFPEVTAATTLLVRKEPLAMGKEVFYQDGLFADERLFEVFTIDTKAGIGAEALQDPNFVLLTESTATQYFPDESPLDQTLLYQDKLLTVKGVIADPPENQHFSYDFITSLKNLPFYDEEDVWYSNTSWYSDNYYTYARLNEGANAQALEEKLASLESRYTAKYFPGETLPRWFLQPLEDIHLHSQLNYEIEANSDIRYIYLLGAIALIIFLLAFINYVNLSTARSSQRYTEVGMRKVLGARKRQLAYQFLGESSILTFTSFVAAIILVNISLPLFNQLLGQTIPFNIIFSGFLLPGMMLTALLIGALSGLYPAFVLSAIPPVKALKGGLLKNAKTGSLLRNTLVVGQFVAAIVLTIGSMVIYQQLQYIQSKKLGYNREQVVYLSYKQEGVFEKVPLIRNELLRHQNIEKVSFGRYLPLNMDSQTTAEEWEGNEAQAELSIYRNYVDPHFVDLFEMELVEGRSFSAEHQTNSIRSYLLNESALAALGWTSAVGKQFRKGQVIGVVKDFHFQPFNLSIKPLFLAMQKPNTADQGHVILKVKMAEIEETLAFVQETMKSILPQAPFEYGFLDESYAELYGAEIRLGKVFSIFTLLALLIACLGLFGLITNQVLQRRKEIGIRKVIGATLSNIVMLLSKDFLRLVILATLIAFPLAWWGTNRWLDDFVYHIEARWWIFALAGLTILFVALLTVGFQSARAAMANPIQSLKTE